MTSITSIAALRVSFISSAWKREIPSALNECTLLFTSIPFQPGTLFKPLFFTTLCVIAPLSYIHIPAYVCDRQTYVERYPGSNSSKCQVTCLASFILPRILHAPLESSKSWHLIQKGNDSITYIDLSSWKLYQRDLIRMHNGPFKVELRKQASWFNNCRTLIP